MRARTSTTSYPAPTGGWNARDGLAEMKPTDAVVLDNWFPTTTSVNVRRGYLEWSTGYLAPVETLMRYAPTSGAYKLFAVSGVAIYDATASGPVGIPVVTGLTNAQWCHTNIVTPGGSFLWAVNGEDDAKIYDGTTWADVSITGVASNLIVQVCVFGNRLFLVEKNKLKVWYLAVQSIAGAATAFDLSTIFTRGGYLMTMGTWSIDGGTGLEDMAVFVSSEGEVAIYKGIDPTSWEKVGVYHIGHPIGRKCLIKMGGDCLLLSDTGIFPLSRALQSATINRSVQLTDKIQQAIGMAVSNWGQNYGWQMMLYPDANQLWLNVPMVPTMSQSVQYVMNTITGAWCRFTGMNAQCWENMGSAIYFGGQNTVYRAWVGQLDASGAVQADALQAFSNFKTDAQQKYFTMVRPSLLADGRPSILYGLNLDFLQQPATGALPYYDNSTMVWGSMVWGSMVWGGGLQQISQWQTVGGIGRYAALRMTVQNNGSRVQWNETSFLYQVGGVL